MAGEDIVYVILHEQAGRAREFISTALFGTSMSAKMIGRCRRKAAAKNSAITVKPILISAIIYEKRIS